jgi:hypothetical protein
VNVELTFEQRARLELIALHAGKSADEMLIEAVKFLFAQDVATGAPSLPAEPQAFLPESDLEARLARILRH